MRKRLVFDIETNGLLHQLTRVHLIIIYDLDAEELLVFRENRAEQAVRLLQNADLIIGHNIINFDIPALEKLFPWFAPQGCIRDTLILTRLMYPHIKERDYELHRRGQLPGKLIGAHSLKAWGYRLGEHKAQFGDDDLDSWAEWSPEMEAYARQDVIVTVTLWDWLCDQIERQEYSEAAISFEHRFADLMARQERNGFCFDEDGAKVLYQQLLARRAELIANLQRQFRPWYVPAKWQKGRKAWTADAAETTVPPKTITYADPLKASRVAGAPFTPIKLLEFNPGSRDMVADRLQRLFGWVPKEFTDTGKPRVSEDILRDLVGELDAEEDGIEETEQELYERFVTRIPQAADLAEYFLVQKRIGQLAEGKNGWLKLVREGKIHGSINTLGAVTRRCTHSKPNVSQAPAVRSPYGREMRSLWYTPARWLLFGTDLSGIEIRCFANVLAEFDGGEYANIVINGDVHTANQQAFGVPTRDNAKTTLYALLYGAGDEKLGSIIGKGAAAGRQIKMNFMKAVPAYPKVVKKLQRMADKQGWIPALDGGRLYVRSAHRTLNTCLQSMGSLVAKNWAMQLEENLTDAGLVHGWHGDFAFCAYNHDEIQIAFRAPEVDLRAYVNDTPYSSWTVESTGAKNAEDLEKKVKKHKEQHLQDWFIANSPVAAMLAQEAKHAVKQTEEHFAFQCPLDCEYKVGQHWADCH